MPGLFGFFGNDKTLADTLCSQYKNKYNPIKYISLDSGQAVMGLHSHDRDKEVGRFRSGYFVVDGESGIYGLFKWFEDFLCRWVENNEDKLLFPEGCSGNILIYDQLSLNVYLYKDWSSCFPIYYTVNNKNLLISNFLKPISRVLNSEPDPVGVNQYLVHGFCIGSRTQFQHIKKLCPGQLLTYSIKENNYKIAETSKLWCDGETGNEIQYDFAVDKLSMILNDSCHRNLYHKKSSNYGLMLSAGWDSRLVLSSIVKNKLQDNCVCVSYENSIKSSRELNIVSNMAKGNGLSLIKQKAILNTYCYEKLDEFFSKTETCCFPEWYFIGKKMKELNIDVMTCGILGEVVGGQYSIGKISNRFFQGLNFLLSYLSIYNKSLSIDEATDYLIKYYARSPWYLDEDYKIGNDVIDGAIEDINKEVERLRKRGIGSGNSIIEAFITEHRGMGHIAEQSNAIRASVDLYLPLADRDFLRIASTLPDHMKIQNRITKSIIQLNSRRLLDYPTSAVLVPAKYPSIMQEITRICRFLIDKYESSIFLKSKGAKSPKLNQYRNAEYLRDSFFMDGLLNETSLEYIKKDMLISLMEDTRQYKNATPSWFIYWALMKILAIDFMVHKHESI